MTLKEKIDAYKESFKTRVPEDIRKIMQRATEDLQNFPQLAKFNKRIAEEKNLSVDILSDPGNEVAARYGLKYQMPDDLIAIYQQFGLDVPKHNGDDSWTLPIPATLIIDTDEVIRHTHINADYTIRTEPAETLNVLKKIL